MINDFMPDIDLSMFQDISDQYGGYSVSVLCNNLALPCTYDLFCHEDSRTHKVHWIVFKRALYRLPSMRVFRWKVSAYNYPTDSMDSAIDKAYESIITNLMLLDEH